MCVTPATGTSCPSVWENPSYVSPGLPSGRQSLFCGEEAREHSRHDYFSDLAQEACELPLRLLMLSLCIVSLYRAVKGGGRQHVYYCAHTNLMAPSFMKA